jgi:uncharacterized protein
MYKPSKFNQDTSKTEYLCTDGMQNKLYEYLYKEEFIIDKNRDEYIEMSKCERNALFDDYFHLFVLPTEECNFRCKYCYEEYKRGKMSRTIQQKLIDLVDEKMKIYKGLNVSWFGGEPLEALDVIQNLSKDFIEICNRYKKVYFAGITTNGYNLSIDTIKLLKNLHVTEFQITLDGLPEDHDQLRVLQDGSGTANIIIKNLLDIKNFIHSKTIRIILRTNFTKSALKRAKDFASFLKCNFDNDSRFYIFWQVAEDYGRLPDESIREAFCDYDDFICLIENHALSFQHTMYEFSLRPAGSICYAMKRNALVISSDGTIKKCTCNLEDSDNMFGNVDNLFDSNMHDHWLERNVSEKMRCYTCKKRPICHNRACKKYTTCPPNLLFFDKMLEKMSKNPRYYIQLEDIGIC